MFFVWMHKHRIRKNDCDGNRCFSIDLRYDLLICSQPMLHFLAPDFQVGRNSAAKKTPEFLFIWNKRECASYWSKSAQNGGAYPIAEI
jgi:hypothetical protein